MTAGLRLDTERAIAHPLGDDDLAALRQIWTDARVTATLSATGEPFSEAAIRQRLEAAIAHWNAYGFGIWLFRDRSGDRESNLIGYCGVRHATVEERAERELLYGVVSGRWGGGLATEMAAAVLNWTFDRANLPDVVCYTLTTNFASQRVMAKLGFRVEKPLTHVGLPHLLHRHTRENWRATWKRWESLP